MSVSQNFKNLAVIKIKTYVEIIYSLVLTSLRRKQPGYSLNVNFFVITAKAAKVLSTCEKPLSTCRENVILKVLFRVLFLYDFFPLEFTESRRHCGAKTLKLSSLSENQDWYLRVSRFYPAEVLWEGSNGSQLLLSWGTCPGPNVGAIFDSKKGKLHSTQACTFHFGVLCALLRVLRLRSYFSRKNSATIFFDLLDRILSFLLQGVLLFCEFSLPIICIRSVYYHSSRPVRKQLFHVITINVETDLAFTDGYWTIGGNLQWNALRDGLFILGEHCLWLREGRDILRLLNTFETITSHRNVAPM